MASNHNLPIHTLDPAQVDYIRDVYEQLRAAGLITRSVDMIAYTEDFDKVASRVREYFPYVSKSEIFSTLINKRKQGYCKVGRKSRKKLDP